MFEDISSNFSWQNIVDNQLAKAGQKVTSFVQFLDFGMIVLVLLVIINEHVILNEVIQELNESIGGAEDQGSKNRIPEKIKITVLPTLTENNIWQD